MYKIIVVFFSVLLLTSCSTKEKKNPSDALDTGRTFIRASLDGDFETAEKLILSDDENKQAFDSYRSYYKRLDKSKQQHYKNASYEINNYAELNDSTTIINYSNDYMNKPMDVKVVLVNHDWKIDFKYTWSGNQPMK